MSEIHQMAFSKNGRYLTKCGVTTVDRSEVRAFNPTCPSCAERGSWPSAAEQKAFAR